MIRYNLLFNLIPKWKEENYGTGAWDTVKDTGIRFKTKKLNEDSL